MLLLFSILTLRFLLPNLVVSVLLAVEFIVVFLFLDETHHTPLNPPVQWWHSLRALWQLFYGRRPPIEPSGSPSHSGEDYQNGHNSRREGGDDHESRLIQDVPDDDPISTTDTYGFSANSLTLSLVIATAAITQFCASAYNKLLIDFLNSPLPAGRDLPPKESGYVWSGTALVSIAFQGLAFAKISGLLGYSRCYCIGLLILSFSWFYTPFIGLNGGSVVLWTQLALGLTLRKVADITVFACAMVLVYFFSWYANQDSGICSV